MTKKFSFFSRNEYFEELISLVASQGNGDHIDIASMAFRPDEPKIAELIDSLCAAAKRGARVRMLVDAHAFMADNGLIPGPLFLNTNMPKRMHKTFRNRLNMLEAVKAAGGQYVLLNKSQRRFSSPVSGRSHIKFCVINDLVFIGGYNLSKSDSTDLMVSWTDRKISQYLSRFAEGLISSGSVHNLLESEDTRIRINKSTELLIDAGVKKQSLIRSEALKLIDSAEKYIYLTCQFFPNDAVLDQLEAAIRRGVDVKFIYNNPLKHDVPYNVVHWSVTSVERLKRNKVLFEHQLPLNAPFLHAKLLATDKGAMIGSHNYVAQGVNFGTAEMTVFSSDPEFGINAKQKLIEKRRSANTK